MAKFLNKKEQVFDFKLTSYGHYLLSNGTFSPFYYGFFDDNIIYDGKYVGLNEKQNQIHERIKNDTQYIESLVLFEEVEKSPNTLVNVLDPEDPSSAGGARTAGERYYNIDYIPTSLKPRNDIFRFEHMIGDAFLEGETQNAPAWKFVTLKGQISGSTAMDIKNDVGIPQINVDANYTLKIHDRATFNMLTNTSLLNAELQTRIFSDDKFIAVEHDDTILYLEELNTILLNENYDVEVFEIDVDATPASHAGGSKTDQLIRKTFMKDYLSLKGDLITDEYFDGLDNSSMTPNNTQVEYFFSIKTDHEVNQKDACKGSELFSKESYYIDLDFDCTQEELDKVYYDIYGPVTEPEICP
tara:strand:+ start:108 stop:1175 length:1068 start_codon:yes stop_codon:yes gene_type:complete